MSATPAPPDPATMSAAGLTAVPTGAHPAPVTTISRKDDHLRIAAGERALHSVGTGIDRHRLVHRALPGRDLAQVDLRTNLLGHELEAPLVVSAMTGGTAKAAVVNERLASAAKRHGIALALGSGRALLRDRSLLPTYLAVDRPPLLLANIGAPQLLEPRGIEQAEQLVEILGADSLTLHLNALQEAIQPEGQPQFSGLFERITQLCARIDPVPVVVKEVGFGLSPEDVELLIQAGVAAVDVAGAGGTNWALVEGERDPQAAEVATAFHGWGIPTASAVAGAVRQAAGRVPVIASGGVRDGVEAAICLALGAHTVGFARELLLAAQADRADHAIGVLIEQLRIATWLTGAPGTAALGSAHLQGAAA